MPKVANYAADNSKDMKWSCFGEENYSLVATESKMLRGRSSDRAMIPAQATQTICVSKLKGFVWEYFEVHI